MSGNSFSLQKSVPSCWLSKDALRALESYLLKEMPRRASVAEDKVKQQYLIALKDGLGQEEFKSIDEYIGEVFRDSVAEVLIRVWVFDDPRLEVTIQFRRERFLSDINIKYSGPNPRDTVDAIYRDLLEVLRTHRLINWILHPNIVVEGGLFGLSLILIPSAITYVLMTDNRNEAIYRLAVTVVLSVILFWVGRWMRPYVSFDTVANRRLRHISGWVLAGFLTYLVFDWLLPRFWK